MTLRTPICDLFGIEKPVFLAGMGGVAYARVCAAVSEAGGFGTLGMASEGPERIREEMRQVRALTRKPFGVDLLAALPETIERAFGQPIEGFDGDAEPPTLTREARKTLRCIRAETLALWAFLPEEIQAEVVAGLFPAEVPREKATAEEPCEGLAATVV